MDEAKRIQVCTFRGWHRFILYRINLPGDEGERWRTLARTFDYTTTKPQPIEKTEIQFFEYAARYVEARVRPGGAEEAFWRRIGAEGQAECRLERLSRRN